MLRIEDTMLGSLANHQKDQKGIRIVELEKVFTQRLQNWRSESLFPSFPHLEKSSERSRDMESPRELLIFEFSRFEFSRKSLRFLSI